MTEPGTGPTVEHFRLVLLWPLRLLPVPGAVGPPWQVLRDLGEASPWREVDHDYEREGDTFQERHYSEFVTFLPYVQQFLYGEGRTQSSDDAGPSMRVFRRRDIAQLRIAAREHDIPVILDVVHVNLYFFDVDVVILNVEVSGGGLPLSQVQELMNRFGRAYPSGWDANGRALHSPAVAEWIGRDGTVLARTDAHEREAFMSHVNRHRASRRTGNICCNHWSAPIRSKKAPCVIVKSSTTVCRWLPTWRWTIRVR